MLNLITFPHIFVTSSLDLSNADFVLDAISYVLIHYLRCAFGNGLGRALSSIKAHIMKVCRLLGDWKKAMKVDVTFASKQLARRMFLFLSFVQCSSPSLAVLETLGHIVHCTSCYGCNIPSLFAFPHFVASSMVGW
jgi:hypothetical protein